MAQVALEVVAVVGSVLVSPLVQAGDVDVLARPFADAGREQCVIGPVAFVADPTAPSRQPAVGQPSANRQRCMRLAYGWPATPALPALHIVRHPPQRAEAGPGVGGVGRVRGAELT